VGAEVNSSGCATAGRRQSKESRQSTLLSDNARMPRAYIGFVDLDGARQQLAAGEHHRSTGLVQPRPGRLIAAKPEHSLQPERGDTRSWFTTYQIAANQLTSGVRVPAKIVPAVTDISERQAAHRRSQSRICHHPASSAPQNRHLNPPSNAAAPDGANTRRHPGTSPRTHAGGADTRARLADALTHRQRRPRGGRNRIGRGSEVDTRLKVDPSVVKGYTLRIASNSDTRPGLTDLLGFESLTSGSTAEISGCRVATHERARNVRRIKRPGATSGIVGRQSELCSGKLTSGPDSGRRTRPGLRVAGNARLGCYHCLEVPDSTVVKGL
jgi:hypothetical protein